MSASWHPLLAEAEFPAEGKLAAQLAGWYVLVARTEDGLHAVNDACTHQASLLSGGKIRRGAVMCPLHGARFDLASGKCLGGAYPAIRRFDLRVTDGMLEVCLPDTPPGPYDCPVVN